MPAVGGVHAPPASSGSSPPRALPGSHSSALQVSREGLKLSPPSKQLGEDSNPMTDILPASKAAAPAETHLWIAPANKRKRRTSPVRNGLGGGAGSDPTRIPPQSPVRPMEWWRRPPSPLLVHVRPLWQSSSEYSVPGSDLSTFSAKGSASPSAGVARSRARARASPPSEGEAAAGGQAHFRLDTTRVCVPFASVLGVRVELSRYCRSSNETASSVCLFCIFTSGEKFRFVFVIYRVVGT